VSDSKFRKYRYRDAKVAEQYDQIRFGSGERRQLDLATRRSLSHALRFLSDGNAVLDLPAGTGRWTDLCVRRKLRYVGADISREMLQVAQKKHESIAKSFSLVQCDATALPFPDASFDCVLAFKFLSLLPEEMRAKVLGEMRRVSRRYLVAQSGYLRSWDPWHALRLGVSRLLGQEWRVRKWAQRSALPGQIAAAGWRPLTRVPIRSGLLSYLWPFGVPYLAVYEREGPGA
jgi:SAM-dependent methyltransferase